MIDKLRLDKWLWAARFFKTRSIAADAIGLGRVRVNGIDAKPSREIRPGDTIALRQGDLLRSVVVRGLPAVRGPASVAQLLYEETPESLQRHDLSTQRRRVAPEPAHDIAHGRPTKRDRRELQKAWNSRWSASSDGDV
ncbi:MAG: ribosome-associated heat shock protein [Burkholderiaceae bacterium]|jgi:ribosome-associated heat shock protein Hsp15|nr:MAG: ribosome-associated heat shock protein [Burkholderiaceae bacterium]